MIFIDHKGIVQKEREQTPVLSTCVYWSNSGATVWVPKSAQVLVCEGIEATPMYVMHVDVR